jgi:drug/metabolite transporter (DMT)-like permease
MVRPFVRPVDAARHNSAAHYDKEWTWLLWIHPAEGATPSALRELKEKVDLVHWIAVLCSFAGVLIISRPGSGIFTWTALLPICNAVTFAIYQIVTRRIAGLESPYTSIFYAGLVGCVLLSAILPDIWMLPQSPWHAAGFVTIGLLGGLGHLILIKAYEYAPASRLAPFSYAQLIWVAIIGFFVFGDFPDGWSLLGMAIIVASGIFMANQQRRQARLNASNAVNTNDSNAG